MPPPILVLLHFPVLEMEPWTLHPLDEQSYIPQPLITATVFGIDYIWLWSSSRKLNWSCFFLKLYKAPLMILLPPLLPRPHAHSLPSRALTSVCLLRVLKKHVPFQQCGALALNLHIRNDTVNRLLLSALCFKDASMLTFVLVAHGAIGCWTSLRSVTWQ